MDVTPPSAPTSHLIALRSPHLEVLVRPDKGADVYAIVDRASGIDILFKPPWGWRDPCLAAGAALDEAGWLERYSGGWQLLLPNAGAPRQVDGATRGYHGEASVVPWTIQERTDTTVTLSVLLTSAPLVLQRQLVLDGATLRVDTSVHNTSDHPISVMWVEHPVFGGPFVNEGCVLDFDAATFIAQAADPEGLRQPGSRFAPSRIATSSGIDLDLAAIPGPQTERRLFGTLTDLRMGSYSIASPRAGFGIRVEWDSSLFPHAWVWQECHATQGFPWFGRAYAIAVEPSNVRTDETEGPLLAGHATWRGAVALSRVAAAPPLSR